MIDLTPLDVRKKRGDFGKGLRGYDTAEVDTFLEMVAERMEVLVKENLAFRKKLGELKEKVDVQDRREQAVQDALVTAQELRRDVKKQAQREAKVLEHEARFRIAAMVAESGRVLNERRVVLEEMERQRERFLKSFRTFLERELDTVEVEFGRAPLEDVTVDLELGRSAWSIGQGEDDDREDTDGGDGDGGDGDLGAREEADDAQATASDARKALNGATEVDEPRPPAGSKGEDSLWLSSIMSDRENKDAG